MPEAAARVGFVAVTRARLLPVLVMPVVAGALAGRGSSGIWRWPAFALSLAALAAAHLAANVLQDVVDDLTGADAAARADGASVATGSGAIGAGIMGRNDAMRLSGLLFAAAITASGALALTDVAAAGAMIAAVVLMAIVVSPAASRVPGIGEIAAFAASLFGAVAAANANAATWEDGLHGGAVPALFVGLVMLDRQLLRYRGDRAVGVRSTAAALGPERTLGLSGLLTAGTYGLLVVLVLVAGVPWVALAGIVTAIPVGAAWHAARGDPVLVQRHLALLGATLGGALATGAALAAALALFG